MNLFHHGSNWLDAIVSCRFRDCSVQSYVLIDRIDRKRSSRQFVIRKTANKAAKLNADHGSPPAKLYAKLPDFNVFVNDAWFDNSTESYPLLVLNDVTYFPMTWKLAVEDLGLTTKFENNAFYISK